jgi:hypothetical protein
MMVLLLFVLLLLHCYYWLRFCITLKIEIRIYMILLTFELVITRAGLVLNASFYYDYHTQY